MSSSRRKTAIIGVTTAPSDKPFKVDEHRAERHAARAAVIRTQNGCGNDGGPPCRHRDLEPVIGALAQANPRETLIGRNIEVKEEAFALLPIQAQKSNSRVLNFDSQSSRRREDSNPRSTHCGVVQNWAQ